MALLLLLPTSTAYMLAAPLRASAPAGSALPSWPRPSLLPTALKLNASPTYMVSLEDLSLLTRVHQQQSLEYSVAMIVGTGSVRLPLIATCVAALWVPLLAFRFAPRFMQRVVRHAKGFALELRATAPMRMADRLLGKEPVAPLELQSAHVPSLGAVMTARRSKSAADRWASVDDDVRKAAQSESSIYMRQIERQNGLSSQCKTQAPRAALVTMSREGEVTL